MTTVHGTGVAPEGGNFSADHARRGSVRGCASRPPLLERLLNWFCKWSLVQNIWQVKQMYWEWITCCLCWKHSQRLRLLGAIDWNVTNPWIMKTHAIVTDIKYSRNCSKTTARRNPTLPGTGLWQWASFTIKWYSYSSHLAYCVSFLHFSREDMKENEKVIVRRS